VRFPPATRRAWRDAYLEPAIQWFPDALLSRSMAALKRKTAIEYSASGLLGDPPIPWVDSVVPSFAVSSLALLIFGQSELGIEIKDRGRVPAGIIAQYREATGK